MISSHGTKVCLIKSKSWWDGGGRSGPEPPDERLLPVVKLDFYSCRPDVTPRLSLPKAETADTSLQTPRQGSPPRGRGGVAAATEQEFRAIRTCNVEIILPVSGKMLDTGADKAVSVPAPAD